MLRKGIRRPTVKQNYDNLRRKFATFTPLLVLIFHMFPRQAVDLVTLPAAHPLLVVRVAVRRFLSPLFAIQRLDIVIRLLEQAIFQNTQRTPLSLPVPPIKLKIFRPCSCNITPAGAAFDKNPCQAQS
jgi:hypothetical protein